MVGDGRDAVIGMERHATIGNAATDGPATIVTVVCINIFKAFIKLPL